MKTLQILTKEQNAFVPLKVYNPEDFAKSYKKMYKAAANDLNAFKKKQPNKFFIIH
jgi:hypothetical protein